MHLQAYARKNERASEVGASDSHTDASQAQRYPCFNEFNEQIVGGNSSDV